MRFDNLREEINKHLSENPDIKNGGLTLLSKIEKITPNKKVREIHIDLLMRFGSLGTKWKANVTAKLQNTLTGKESEESKEVEWFLGNYDNVDKEAYVLSASLNQISPLVYELCALEDEWLINSDYNRIKSLGEGVSEFGIPVFTGDGGVGGLFISTALLGFETDGIKPKGLGVSFGDIFSGRCKFSDNDNDLSGTTISFEIKFVRKIVECVVDEPNEKPEDETTTPIVIEEQVIEEVAPKKRGRKPKVVVGVEGNGATEESSNSVYTVKKRIKKAAEKKTGSKSAKSDGKKVKKAVSSKKTKEKTTDKKKSVVEKGNKVVFSTGIDNPEKMMKELLEAAMKEPDVWTNQ